MAEVVTVEVSVVAEVAVIVLNVVAMVDQTHGPSVDWLLLQEFNFVGQSALPSWVLKKYFLILGLVPALYIYWPLKHP